MGDDDDGIAAFQIVDQFLDPRGRDRVQCRAGFVHQDHFGIDRDGAGDAETLLLAAGQGRATVSQTVLDLFPQTGPFKRTLDDLLQFAAAGGQAVNARAIGNVFEDRLGKRVGLLEHHANPRAQLHDIHAGSVDVLPVKQDLTFHPGTSDRVVHPVEAAQEGGFATAGRADEGGHILRGDVDRDIVDGSLVTIEYADVAGSDLGLDGIQVVKCGHQRFSKRLRR